MRSINDIYKIGTGPSSSHTMGPAAAAKQLMEFTQGASNYKVILYGSLAKTGKGHGTDIAVKQVFTPKECEVIFSKLQGKKNIIDYYKKEHFYYFMEPDI